MSITHRSHETGRSQLFALLRQPNCIEVDATPARGADGRCVSSEEFVELRRVASRSLQMSRQTHLQ